VKEGGRGFPERDRSLPEAAVSDTRGEYDVIVLLPYRGCTYPDREMAMAYSAAVRCGHRRLT
jgi:hypothetical protein